MSQPPTTAVAARPLSRRAFAITAAAALAAPALLTPFRVEAAPKSRLIGEEWTRFGGGGDPDYGPWAAFLGRWLSRGADGVTLVDYRGAKAAGARAPLRAFLDETQRVDPTTLTRDAAMAWWVNLYNAATIDLVLGAYPVDTILKIEGGLFNTGPWDEEVLKVNGRALSLNDVEHGILRPVWGDARVHYAVNCASIGCPDLADAPWTSAGLSDRLDAGARAYVNHPRGARVDGGRLIVSKIYDWFEEDFGGGDAGVIAHLKRYAEGGLAAALGGIDRVSDSEYDWSLNEA